MATLSIPPVLTTPRQDAMDLYKAFKGDIFRQLSMDMVSDFRYAGLLGIRYKASFSM
jgi:hypothetical protein